MEKFKAVLVEKSQGDKTLPVVTATNISISFQNSFGTGVDSLSDGNFDISADLEMTLLNGQTAISKMPNISRKLAELETVIGNMKANDPEKAKLQSELAIWTTMISKIQYAIAEGLKSNYELKNPIQ